MAAIKHPIPYQNICQVSFDEQEIEAVTKLLRNPERLFRHRGEETSESDYLEKEVCALTGAKHALFVSSGTSALSCCLAALRIGPGDEVIVPAYTYIATAAAVIDVGGVPVLAEIDETLGLDPADVEKKITPYTKAVIMTHMQGVPGRLGAVREIAKKHGLYMVEDCCQAIGARYHGVYCGVESDAFAWSLNYFKTITCGEGGIFFAKDDVAFQLGVCQSDPANLMWKSGLLDDGVVKPFSRAGYRANEMSAAVGRVQLTKLEGIVTRTRALKKHLIDNLNPTPKHYKLQYRDDPEGDAGISFAVICNSAEETKTMVEKLAEEGLELGSLYNAKGFPDRHIYAYWDSIMNKVSPTDAGYPWKDPAYKGNVEYSKDMCPRTLDILNRSLRLAINPGMSEVNMEEIAAAINAADASF